MCFLRFFIIMLTLFLTHSLINIFSMKYSWRFRVAKRVIILFGRFLEILTSKRKLFEPKIFQQIKVDIQKFHKRISQYKCTSIKLYKIYNYCTEIHVLRMFLQSWNFQDSSLKKERKKKKKHPKRSRHGKTTTRITKGIKYVDRQYSSWFSKV